MESKYQPYSISEAISGCLRIPSAIPLFQQSLALAIKWRSRDEHLLDWFITNFIYAFLAGIAKLMSYLILFPILISGASSEKIIAIIMLVHTFLEIAFITTGKILIKSKAKLIAGKDREIIFCYIAMWLSNVWIAEAIILFVFSEMPIGYTILALIWGIIANGWLIVWSAFHYVERCYKPKGETHLFLQKVYSLGPQADFTIIRNLSCFAVAKETAKLEPGQSARSTIKNCNICLNSNKPIAERSDSTESPIVTIACGRG